MGSTGGPPDPRKPNNHGPSQRKLGAQTLLALIAGCLQSQSKTVQPTSTVTLVLSFLPFFGANVSLTFAASLRPLCFLRVATSAFVNVNLTVRVPPVAELVVLDALEAPPGAVRPLPVATSLPALGTETWIVAVRPLTLCLTT